MGKIKINIRPEVTPAGTDEVTVLSFAETECTTDFVMQVQVGTTGYLSWTFDPNVTISGGGVAETLAAGTYNYTVTITGFKGFATAKQTITSSVLAELKDSEFGSVLDSKTVLRSHTTLEC